MHFLYPISNSIRSVYLDAASTKNKVSVTAVSGLLEIHCNTSSGVISTDSVLISSYQLGTRAAAGPRSGRVVESGCNSILSATPPQHLIITANRVVERLLSIPGDITLEYSCAVHTHNLFYTPNTIHNT